jgi:hypothetical protein
MVLFAMSMQIDALWRQSLESLKTSHLQQTIIISLRIPFRQVRDSSDKLMFGGFRPIATATVAAVMGSLARRPFCPDPMMAWRMPPEMKAEIEDWAKQGDVPRSEAIRQLIELGLQSVKKRGR